MLAVLAVDLGKTSCRAALWTQAALSADPLLADGPGAPGLAARDGVELAERAIANVYRQVRVETDPLGPLAVCIGAAGALAAPEASRRLAGRLSALIPAGVFAICSDAVIAHAGALAGRDGLVLVLGTGSVVLGISTAQSINAAAADPAYASERPEAPGPKALAPEAVGPEALGPEAVGLVQVDGWGPLLGDLGGGGWIGAAGLRAALRAFDGRGPATGLEQAAVAEFGDLAMLPAQFSGRNDAARQAARFAPTVGGLADAGDLVSGQILAEAAAHLAESVAAGQRRLSAGAITAAGSAAEAADLPLVITGGLTALGPALLGPLTTAIGIAAPGLRIEGAAGNALDGARRLATDASTGHERYVVRVRTDEVRPDEARPDEARPDEVRPDQARDAEGSGGRRANDGDDNEAYHNEGRARSAKTTTAHYSARPHAGLDR